MHRLHRMMIMNKQIDLKALLESKMGNIEPEESSKSSIAIMNELPLNWTYPEIQPRLLEEARQRGFLPKKDEIKWLVFDVGSTLVDESRVYEDRMKKIAELSDRSTTQIYEHEISLYGRNKKIDLEIRINYHLAVCERG